MQSGSHSARDRQHQPANRRRDGPAPGHLQQGEPVQHAELRSCGRGPSAQCGRRSTAEDRICQSISTSAGRFSDWAKSRRGCGNGGERSSTINSNTDPSLASMTPGPKNYAWDMIKQSPLEGADRQMRELVMTLTGTIVVGKRPSDNDPLPIIYRGEAIPRFLMRCSMAIRQSAFLGCDETDRCLGPGRRHPCAWRDGSSPARQRVDPVDER